MCVLYVLGCANAKRRQTVGTNEYKKNRIHLYSCAYIAPIFRQLIRYWEALMCCRAYPTNWFILSMCVQIKFFLINFTVELSVPGISFTLFHLLALHFHFSSKNKIAFVSLHTRPISLGQYTHNFHIFLFSHSFCAKERKHFNLPLLLTDSSKVSSGIALWLSEKNAFSQRDFFVCRKKSTKQMNERTNEWIQGKRQNKSE